MPVETIDVPRGVCLGFGGTNARMAICAGGEISDFKIEPTPKRPQYFFKWMARHLLDASQEGNEWMVAGFPGLISRDSQLVGPMQNVRGMAKRKFNLLERLTAADSAVADVIEDGFMLLPVNDGTLSAHAAASRISEFEHETVASLIIGTGVGTGIVDKDGRFGNVYRADNRKSNEIGHIPYSDNISYEEKISGLALTQRYGVDSKILPIGHKAWVEVSVAIRRLSATLGLMNDVELVVPCGGVGSGGSTKYSAVLQQEIKRYMVSANQAQREKQPEIMPVPPSDCDKFEMYGAEGVMREHLAAISV